MPWTRLAWMRWLGWRFIRGCCPRDVGCWGGKTLPGKIRGTADPSTPLRCGRDDKGEGGALRKDWLVAEETAGPSTALRSGRDDTSVWGWSVCT